MDEAGGGGRGQEDEGRGAGKAGEPLIIIWGLPLFLPVLAGSCRISTNRFGELVKCAHARAFLYIKVCVDCIRGVNFFLHNSRYGMEVVCRIRSGGGDSGMEFPGALSLISYS